jgi:hypothetical protein
VQARAHVEVEFVQRVDHGAGASDGPGRPVE